MMSICNKRPRIGKVGVYVIDSLLRANCELANRVKIQLAKIYGYNCRATVDFMPKLQQQTQGSMNFGLFAFAHMVEYCNNASTTFKASMYWRLDDRKLGSHLLNCLKANKSSYPKVTVTRYMPVVQS